MKGFFGNYGGMYISEILLPLLNEIEQVWLTNRNSDQFKDQYQKLLHDYAGRPTPLYFSSSLSKMIGCSICLKREDLLHSGAHKINNTLGQGLLAKLAGKNHIIAETGAGQHGVATAMVGALLNLQTTIFMGAEDIKRQMPNVTRMRLFGAKVHTVNQGTKTLKDAINEALRFWCNNAKECFYIFGTVAGPHPYPSIVRSFQSHIGRELARQCQSTYKKKPNHIIACVGGGSNAIGAFAEFINDPQVCLYGIEAGGKGLQSGFHGASITKGSPGILHGAYSYVLQNNDGQICEAHSISAGLDYPSVGPEHAHLHDSKRVLYTSVDDKQAVAACRWLCRHEGILPALESSHALAYVLNNKQLFHKSDLVVIILSGRGDKDIHVLMEQE